MYTLNLPGISTLTLSFLSPILALKSTPMFVIVISFANKSHPLSIPYVFTWHFASLFTRAPLKSSIFTNPIWHILNNFIFELKYSSMSPCSFWLMCSFEKFVNTPTSKLHPATLCNFNACDDTSITTNSTFSSTICANILWRSMLSGVVLSLSPKLSSPI